MENMLLQLLPKEKHPVAVRYAASTAIVGLAAALRYSVGAQLQNYPLLLFFPAVFLCALLFDKGSGFFATLLSALIAALLFISPTFSFEVEPGDILALGIFVLVGCTMAGVTEALRKTVDGLAAAERSKSLLLEELAHRMKNDLAIISSAISLQARASEDAAVREALEGVNARVQVVAGVHARLRTTASGAEVDLSDYLEALCLGLGDMFRGVRPIAVRVHCPKITVTEATAVSIGLIVNELVTNSLKYAFPTERGGIVDVRISALEKGGLQVAVYDNGAGCDTDATGLGTRLVRLLAKQRGGSFERKSSADGCEAIAVLPDIQ